MNLKQLSIEEEEEFKKMRDSNNGIDSKTFDLSLKYFLQYKQKVEQMSTQKLQIVLKSALFVAEKSQNIQTITGQRIIQPSMTLSHLLKAHDPEAMMITLADFSKRVEVQDRIASAELGNLIKEMSFLITFHKKFKSIVSGLELQERHPQQGGGEYLKNWQSFAWLVYIQSKNKILNEKEKLGLIENTCLLAHIIAFMLTFAWEYALPKGVLKKNQDIKETFSLNEAMPILRKQVMESFSIKANDVYASIAEKFEDLFDQELMGKGIVKTTSKEVGGFLSPDYLQANYKKLDKYYEKHMGTSDLDGRIFFKQRLTNMTPSKFTPFARQGNANKGRKFNNNDTTHKDSYMSHRIINFDVIDKIENMKNMKQELNISALPKNVLKSPSSTIRSNLLQTPITTGMEMYNYVHEKARKIKEILAQGNQEKRPFEKNMYKYIQMFVQIDKKNCDKKTKEIREHLIYSLFKLALEEYLSLHPNQEQNQGIYLGLMTMSVEIVLFVNNSSVTFDDIQREVTVPSFQMWKACDFFANFDRSMPSSMKMHLIDLEAGFLTYKLWREHDNINMMIRVSNGEKEHPSISEFSDRLFRKMLVQTAFQVNQMGGTLGFQDHIIEKVFDTLKKIFTDHTQMLQNHHIDQLIMCSFFAFSKIFQLNLRFGEIIDYYREISLYNKEIHDDIVHKIPVKDREPVNLIEFYNSVFIRPLKEYIKQKKEDQQFCNEPRKKMHNPLLMSPLKDVLPRELNTKNVKKAVKDANTNLLISYSDSPLLKREPLSFKGVQNPKSRKMIDFEHEQKDHAEFKQEKVKEYQKLSPKAVTNHHQYPKKTGNFGLPWKAPQQTINSGFAPNGHTPTRTNKTVSAHSNFELTQFNTNPTPHPSSKMIHPTQKQQIAFGKGRANYH